MSDYYILDEDGEPMLAETLFAWAMWFENAGKSRVLQQNHTPHRFISTVFLGLDMSHGEGPPLTFETMTFIKVDGQIDWAEESVERYSTRSEALAGHAKWLEIALARDVEEYGEADD